MERQTGSTRLTGSPGGQGGWCGRRRFTARGEGSCCRGVRNTGRDGARRAWERRVPLSRACIAEARRTQASSRWRRVRAQRRCASWTATVPAMRQQVSLVQSRARGVGTFLQPLRKGSLRHALGSTASREEMLQAVQGAAEGEYEVLGEMERSEGGGVVYFARELKSGRLVALRLTREQESDGSEIVPARRHAGASSRSSHRWAPRTPHPHPVCRRRPLRRLARPRRHRARRSPAARSPTPPSVMVPDEPIGEERPRRSQEEAARSFRLAIAAGLLLVGGGLFVFSGSRASRPMERRIRRRTSSCQRRRRARVADTLVGRSDASTAARSFSSDRFPRGARVTLNGKIGRRSTARAATRADIELAASAPGYKYRNAAARGGGGRNAQLGADA